MDAGNTPSAVRRTIPIPEPRFSNSQGEDYVPARMDTVPECGFGVSAAVSGSNSATTDPIGCILVPDRGREGIHPIHPQKESVA